MDLESVVWSQKQASRGEVWGSEELGFRLRGAEKEEAEALLEQKMDRWAYLEELAIRIENGEYV